MKVMNGKHFSVDLECFSSFGLRWCVPFYVNDNSDLGFIIFFSFSSKLNFFSFDLFISLYFFFYFFP